MRSPAVTADVIDAAAAGPAAAAPAAVPVGVSTMTAVTGAPPEIATAARNASATSPARWYRAPGSGARHLATMRSTSVWGGSSPPVGRSPVSSSCSTTPRE